MIRRALITLALAGSTLAGYYGRELQDALDRTAENPIGPYQTIVNTDVFKTHTRTGRVWVFKHDREDEKKWYWIELVDRPGSQARKG